MEALGPRGESKCRYHRSEWKARILEAAASAAVLAFVSAGASVEAQQVLVLDLGLPGLEVPPIG